MAGLLYCLNSSTIKPTPILDKIAIAGKTGYAAIELWHDDIDAHVSAGGRVSDVRKAVEDQGLAVPTTIYLKGWFDTEGKERQQALEECKRRMAQAVEVGATYCIAGPPLGTGLDYELGGRRYRELLETGLAMGVKPAVEYLGFADELNTIEAALAVITQSGHPEATVVLDPFHCFRGGGPIESISKLTSKQIAISHFNDAPAKPPRGQQHDRDRVMPGDGSVDLERYVTLLRGTGYDRWLSLELFREDLWASDPREVARVGLEKMRAVVEG